MRDSASEAGGWPGEALVFEIWGDYGCFRRFYTTRSPLTFPVPPRPTIAGIVGGILGVPKSDVAKVFDPERARLAVAMVKPVKIAHFGLNWLETKGQVLSVGLVEARTQINAEFLKQPRFRIYVMLRDQSRQRELSQMVRDHRSVYTPCLGISELLADFAWLGDWSARPAGQSVVNVTSVLPVASVVWPMEGQGVEFENRKRYDKKRVPRLMDENRVVLEWQDVLAETSGQTIRAQVADGWQIGDDYVVWL